MFYFVSNQHELNYEYLLSRWSCGDSDYQRQAALYITALPLIYEIVPNDLVSEDLPLFGLAEWDEEESAFKWNHPALTGSTRQICKFAVSLFNGYPISLMDVFGTVADRSLVTALFQAFLIRCEGQDLELINNQVIRKSKNSNISFLNEEHEGNYQSLMAFFGRKKGDDRQWESALFLTALPNLFRPSMIKGKPDRLPLWNYTSVDADGEWVFDHPTLTGTDLRICTFAVSIFNGYPTSLDEVIGTATDLKLRLVLLETLRIHERFV